MYIYSIFVNMLVLNVSHYYLFLFTFIFHILYTVQCTVQINPQNYIDDRIDKYESYIVFFSKQDCRNEECLSRREIDTKGGGGGTHRQHIVHSTPRLAGRGDWWWSEGAPGQYQSGPPPPSLHFYTI